MIESYALSTLAAVDSIGDVKLNPAVVAILVGSVIPILVGLLTKAKSRWTGLLNILLNAVNAILITAVVVEDEAILSATTMINGLLSAAAAMVAYFNAWAPNGITNNPTANPQGEAKLGADKGIG